MFNNFLKQGSSLNGGGGGVLLHLLLQAHETLRYILLLTAMNFAAQRIYHCHFCARVYFVFCQLEFLTHNGLSCIYQDANTQHHNVHNVDIFKQTFCQLILSSTWITAFRDWKKKISNIENRRHAWWTNLTSAIPHGTLITRMHFQMLWRANGTYNSVCH